MHKLILILFVSTSFCMFAQNIYNFRDSSWRMQSNFTAGVSSFEGYSIGLGFGISKKLNNIELSAGLDSQIGNVKHGYIFPAPYNDKFYHIDLMYGRIFQRKRFVTCFNAGFNYYHYIDKFVYYQSYEFIGGGYVSDARSYNGIGLLVSPSVGLVLNKNNVLLIEGNYYWNVDVSIANLGICWQMIF